ncbi:PspC domain-containing protein [Corynebacterium ulceribovis]|uniref:PspC domain-containing protein n=1 Tax=Corynebacterium ulceribovis TaxID=487732 RepID=UPI00037EB129|nr:PspC domain-containing protein [Corynebacterium ulceribovis]
MDNTPKLQRELRRSSTHKIFLGVLGGFAETYNIDPTLLRVAFIASFLLPGPQILIYLVAALLMKPPLY